MSDAAKLGKKLEWLQVLCGLFAVLGLAYTVAWRRSGSGLLIPVMVTLVFGMALLLLVAARIRTESKQTGQHWYVTACFVEIALWLSLCAALVALTSLSGILSHELAWFQTPKFLLGSMVSCLAMGLIAARIVVTNRLLSQGRELPNGDTKVSGFAAWSERYLGRWWIGETTLIGAACVLIVGFLQPGLSYGLIILLFNAGRQLYQVIAIKRKLPWPGQDAARKAAARRRELESLPDYEALQSRNASIENWSWVFAALGFLIPAAGFWPLHLFDDHDAHSLWLIGLMIGLMVTAPTIFVLGIILPQGRVRWDDFFMYMSLSSDDPGCKRIGRVVLGCALLTVVSAVGLSISLLSH